MHVICCIVPAYCKAYTNLSDAWRKVRYGNGDQSAHCDNSGVFDGTKWFRFVEPAGTKLPPRPAQQFWKRTDTTNNLICGTESAAWIDGVHPSFSDGIVSRRICFAWRGTEVFGNRRWKWMYGGECNWNTKIKVAKCPGAGEDFYVYQLKTVYDTNGFTNGKWVSPGNPVFRVCDRAYCGI